MTWLFYIPFFPSSEKLCFPSSLLCIGELCGGIYSCYNFPFYFFRDSIHFGSVQETPEFSSLLSAHFGEKKHAFSLFLTGIMGNVRWCCAEVFLGRSSNMPHTILMLPHRYHHEQQHSTNKIDYNTFFSLYITTQHWLPFASKFSLVFSLSPYHLDSCACTTIFHYSENILCSLCSAPGFTNVYCEFTIHTASLYPFCRPLFLYNYVSLSKKNSSLLSAFFSTELPEQDFPHVLPCSELAMLKMLTFLYVILPTLRAHTSAHTHSARFISRRRWWEETLWQVSCLLDVCCSTWILFMLSHIFFLDRCEFQTSNLSKSGHELKKLFRAVTRVDLLEKSWESGGKFILIFFRDKQAKKIYIY